MTFSEAEKKELLNHVIEGTMVATKDKIQDTLNNEGYLSEYTGKVARVAIDVTNKIIESLANDE